jgi:DNA-binding response OmpR family regulator
MTASRLDYPSPSDEETGRILLALADPAEADQLATYLEFEGFATMATDLGSIALALAAKEEPDLMLIDLIMDDLSAFEVSRALKASPRTRVITRLLITDSEAAVNPLGAYESGFADYFCRPFSHADLLHRINDLLPDGEGARGPRRAISWLPSELDGYRAAS